MFKKGKYKLLSYIVEENLIFYKSMNKIKKLIAFSIIDVDNLYPTISILNKFLRNNYLGYYTIQVDIRNIKSKTILLNFNEEKKERIIKFCSLIHNKLLEQNIIISSFSNKTLETKFLSIIEKDINPNLIMSECLGSLLIKNEGNVQILDFYNTNLSAFDNKVNISNFLNLLKNLNHLGYLIISFKYESSRNILVNSYFVDIKKDNKLENNFEKKINQFYNCNVIKKQKIGLNNFFQFIWRSEINNLNFLFTDITKFFFYDIINNFESISIFNKKFEYDLQKKKREFVRINKNLLFIEPNLLFFTSFKLNSQSILKILKRFYQRYNISILILNEKEFNKLNEFKQIKALKEIKLIDPRDVFYNELEKFIEKMI